LLASGVRVDLNKTEAMQNWPQPKNLKILRGFLGFWGYYRKFFQNYGKIASPLTTLLKNNSFSCTLATNHSFQALKETMCTTLVLSFSEFNKTFVLECDALGKGIGDVLMQDGPFGFHQQNVFQAPFGPIHL
jgi:hypothetical protein